MNQTKPKVYTARNKYYCGHWSADPIYFTDRETGYHYCKPCGEKMIKEGEAEGPAGKQKQTND